MRSDFDVLSGAEGWQLSNPPILSLAAIKSSLDIFDEVGISNLRQKSLLLTGYMEYLLNQIPNNQIKIITPANPNERGCQLSVRISNSDKSIHDQLTRRGIISDWREPDVIRLAPVPLYNSFQDVWKTYIEFNNILRGG